MSSYSPEIWQEGFSADTPFPRGSEVGFYQDEVGGYLNKGLQNGGSHSFASSRGRGYSQGASWRGRGVYSHNGYREEKLPLLPAPRRGLYGEQRTPFNPHYHDHTPQLGEGRGYTSHSYHGEEGGGHGSEEYQRRAEFFQSSHGHSYPSPVEERSQNRYGGSHPPPHVRKYDPYSSPTISSSSWSPNVDSPDSPIPTPPLPSTRGRGREGGIHHYGNSMDDVSGSTFHPPVRRHPPPPPPPPQQQLTFHHTRVQEMALSHSQKERALARRRGGFVGGVASAMDRPRGGDDFEGGAVESSSTRDPRLHRKSTQLQPPALPPSTAAATVATGSVPKRQDIHSLLHQILSEHSYAKGKREDEGEEQEEDKLTNGIRNRRITRNQASCYLTTIDRSGRLERKLLMKHQRPAGRSSRAKVAKTETQPDSAITRPKAVIVNSTSFPPCSKHSDNVTFFCATCNEVVCHKCIVVGASHHGHVHYVLALREMEQPKAKAALEGVAKEEPRGGAKAEPRGGAALEGVAKEGGVKAEPRGGAALEGVAEEKLEAKEGVARAVSDLESMNTAEVESSARGEPVDQAQSQDTSIAEPEAGKERSGEVSDDKSAVDSAANFTADVSRAEEAMDEGMADRDTADHDMADHDTDHDTADHDAMDADTNESGSVERFALSSALVCPVISLVGFELDLDTEPSSSEDETMTEEDEEELTCIISYPRHSESRAEPPPKFAPPSFPDEDPLSHPAYKRILESKLSAESDKKEWFITNLEDNKIRLSKVDLARSGGVKRLALYASNSSPSSRADSAESSPIRTRNSATPISEGEGDTEPHIYSSLDSSLEGGFPPSPQEPCPSQAAGGRGCPRRRRRRRGRASLQAKPASVSQRTTRKTKRLEEMKARESAESQRPRASRTSSSFKGFEPEILTTRSRTETATMMRRLEMEKEMERHERERILTARPGDLDTIMPSPPSTCADGADGYNMMDDLSSEVTSNHSYTTSSSLISSSRDIDGCSVRSSLLEEFTPDVIARCKKISTARNSGDTPLHKVCRTGKYDMARYLILVEGASVNAQDNAGWTPLHEACCNRSTKLAGLLLGAGADVNISATDGTRPIHDAIESGNLDLVKLLLNYGADPMAEIGEKTPVEFALANGQMEIHVHLQTVIKAKLKTQQQQYHQQQLQVRQSPRCSPGPALHKMPTRASKKNAPFREEPAVAIPVDGYGPDGPYCGEELSYPLFYVTPIIELSDCPFLPVYNFKMVSNSDNPRCHNFHLISDILDTLVYNEEELLEYCNKVVPLELTVAEVMQQLDTSYHKLPDNILAQPRNKKLRFLPLCSQLRTLLDIEVENLDD